jgi:hypothetical protein
MLKDVLPLPAGGRGECRPGADLAIALDQPAIVPLAGAPLVWSGAHPQLLHNGNNYQNLVAKRQDGDGSNILSSRQNIF